MKIALLSCFYPYRGGIAQFNANLFQELSANNEVKAFNFSRQYPSVLFPGKTQYVTPEDEAVPIESEALLDTVSPFSWLRTARAIRKFAPDLLIMRYWMPYFAPSLGYVARHCGCKSVAILDNVIPHERHFFDKFLTRYFTNGISGGITLCSEVNDDLLSIAPKLPRKVIFHPLYSHFGDKLPREEAERLLGLAPGKKNLLFFGLIRDYKGLDILIDAFGKLGEEYQLIVAGEPYGSFDKYADLIDASGCKDRIHLFLNYVKDSEVKVYFSASDLTVLPYRSATQSGVSSVSYHFNVPMIVTDVGGLKETIGKRGTGLVADSPDSTEIATLIQRYFNSPDIKQQCLGNISKEKERLSWHKFCEEMLNFAKSL